MLDMERKLSDKNYVAALKCQKFIKNVALPNPQGYGQHVL